MKKLSDALFKAGEFVMKAELAANEVIAARVNGDERREDEAIPDIMGFSDKALYALAEVQALAGHLGVPIYDKDFRRRLDDDNRRQELKVALRCALVGAIVDELENQSKVQQAKIKKYAA